jgi:CRP/FNR family cyclic AMP-dependent transcriptional regulator
MKCFTAMSKERFRLLRMVPLFATLRDEQVDALALRARVAYFLAGERLFEQGSIGDGLYLVVRGKLKVTSYSVAGREALLGIEGQGAVIGEISMLDGGPRSASITAIEDSEVLALSRVDMLAYLSDNGDAALALLEILAGRLRRLSRRTEEVASYSIPARLARCLLKLSDDHGAAHADGVRIALCLSQQELGEFIDATRESVNKHLKAWEERGVLGRDREHRQIVVRDRAGLEALANEG